MGERRRESCAFRARNGQCSSHSSRLRVCFKPHVHLNEKPSKLCTFNSVGKAIQKHKLRCLTYELCFKSARHSKLLNALKLLPHLHHKNPGAGRESGRERTERS